jgi:WD40 repeat protein
VSRDKPNSFQLPKHAITALGIAGLGSDGMPRLLVGHRFGILQLWNGQWNQIVNPNNAPHVGTIEAISLSRGEFAYVADIGRTIEDEKVVSKWSLRGAKPAFTGAAYHFPAAGNTADVRLHLSQDGSTLGVIQADDVGRVVGLGVLNTLDLQPTTGSSTSPNSSTDQDYRIPDGGLLDVALSPNGQVMLGMAAGNRLTQWDAQAKTWRPHRSSDLLRTAVSQSRDLTARSSLTRIEFIDDARLLAYGEGIVLVWNLDNGQLEHRIQSRAPIEAAAIIPGAQDQVATMSSDGRYCRWELTDGSREYRLVQQRFLTEFGRTRAVTSHDAKRALVAVTAAGNGSSALEIVELSTGERTPISTVRGRVLAMSWAASGNRVAVAVSDSGSTHVSLIDASSRQSIADIPWQGAGPPTCLALDRDGSRIAAGTAGDIYYAAEPTWNGFERGKSLGQNISALAFSQSGRRLAIGDDNGGIELRAIDEPSATTQEARPPATAPDRESVDRTVMLLSGHDAEITTLQFAPYQDGNVEVLVSGDIHGKSLVHLTSGDKPSTIPAPSDQPAGGVAP